MHYDDIVLNEEVVFNEKSKAIKDGYYLLSLCDFEKGSVSVLKSNSLGDKGESNIVGVYRDGVMLDYVSKIKLDYIDDVGVIFDKGEEFYYFEKPCYVSCKQIDIRSAYDNLYMYDDNPTLVNSYVNVINDQFKHAISGYKEMKDGISKDIKIRKKL